MQIPQFCMCGTQCGYPHPPTCPYPYYGSNKRSMDQWQDASMTRDAFLREREIELRAARLERGRTEWREAV